MVLGHWPPLTMWHEMQSSTSTKHPPQQPDSVHNELCPSTGKGTSVCAGPQLCDTQPEAGSDWTEYRDPADYSPANSDPHNTPPDNNNRMEERQMSCGQEQAPPQRDEAKMSPHISIGPEPVLTVHDQSQAV